MQRRHLTLPLWLVALVAMAAIVVWAPGSAGAQESPSDYHPPDTRTDSEVVNDIIEAIVNGDGDALAELIELMDTTCTTEVAAGPPCPEGVEDGSPVSVFIFAACQPEYLYDLEAAQEALAALAESQQWLLYAVITNPNSPSDDAAYRIIVGVPGGNAASIDVDASGAIIAVVQCGPAVNMTPPSADFLLAPIGDEATPTETPETPTATPTTPPPTNTPTNTPTAEPETPTATPTPTVGQPTATPTRPAPAPPNTGSGSGGSGSSDTVLWLVIVAGVAVAAASASAFVVSRRA